MGWIMNRKGRKGRMRQEERRKIEIFNLSIKINGTKH